jgi:hypothetical protein
MRITFTLSGGFAGLVRHACLDASALGSAERPELERLLAASGLDRSWERFAPAARDLKQYEIVIDRDGSSIRVACDDRCLPDAVRPLVQFLTARSRPGPLPAADAAVDAPPGPP